jgi:prevent-host-death family protein
MGNRNTTTLIDALSARTRFGELMEKAEAESMRYLVSRRGKPKVVILGIEDYLKNIIKKDELLVEVQLSAKLAKLDKMTTAEIDSEIASYRKSRKK